MGNTRKSGFTIIEVMLVLAITGALAVAILAGSTIGINQQRYKDSVVSLKNLMQEQYVATTRVVNADRAVDYACSDQAVISTPPSGTLPRGTADCVIIGRLINVTGGTTVTTANIVGYKNPLTTMPDNDLLALQLYRLSIFNESLETNEVAWGAAIVTPGVHANDTFGLLLLRSPVSGNVLTFVRSGAITNANINAPSVVNGANIQDKKICVDSRGLFTGAMHAVLIKAGASTPTGVEQLGDTSGC